MNRMSLCWVASLVLGGAGCDGEGTGGAGGGQDVTSTGAGQGLETVRIIDEVGAPFADVPVIASDPAGAVTAEVATGADGIARLDVPAGGGVHAALTTGMSPAILRFVASHFDVPEGASITIVAQRLFPVLPAENDPMQVTVTASSLPAGTTQVELSLDCTAGEVLAPPSHVFNGYRGCRGELTFAAFALAYDADGKLLGAGKVADLAFVPGDVRDVMVPVAPTMHDPVAITFTGFAETPRETRLGITGVTRHHEWSRRTQTPEAMQVSLEGPFPKGVFDGWGIHAVAIAADPGIGYERHILSSDDVLPASVALDASDLARIHVTAADLPVPGRPRIAVALDPGPRGKALLTLVQWGPSAMPAPTRWIASMSPADTATGQFPELPASLAAWAPGPGDVILGYEASHVESTLLTSSLDSLAIPWLAGSYTATSQRRD